MLFQSILSAFVIAQAVHSSPVKRSSGEISCSTATVQPAPLSIAPAPEGGYPSYPLVESTSSAGQQQLSLSKDKNAKQVQYIARQCNSTYLGLHYSEQYEPGFNPVKLFLASDESKCIQRHADIHSYDPTAKTHIVIADCSNVDDADQAKQFWDQYQPYHTLNPLVVRNGKEQDLNIVLSDGDSGQVLATSFNPNSQSDQGSYVLT